MAACRIVCFSCLVFRGITRMWFELHLSFLFKTWHFQDFLNLWLMLVTTLGKFSVTVLLMLSLPHPILSFRESNMYVIYFHLIPISYTFFIFHVWFLHISVWIYSSLELCVRPSIEFLILIIVTLNSSFCISFHSKYTMFLPPKIFFILKKLSLVIL